MEDAFLALSQLPPPSLSLTHTICSIYHPIQTKKKVPIQQKSDLVSVLMLHCDGHFICSTKSLPVSHSVGSQNIGFGQWRSQNTQAFIIPRYSMGPGVKNLREAQKHLGGQQELLQ